MNVSTFALLAASQVKIKFDVKKLKILINFTFSGKIVQSTKGRLAIVTIW